MAIRVWTSEGRLSKPAAFAAGVVLVGLGFVVLSFGLALLTVAAAVGAGVATVAMARRAFGRTSLPRLGTRKRRRIALDRDRDLDPSLEVQPRRTPLPPGSDSLD